MNGVLRSVTLCPVVLNMQSTCFVNVQYGHFTEPLMCSGGVLLDHQLRSAFGSASGCYPPSLYSSDAGCTVGVSRVEAPVAATVQANRSTEVPPSPPKSSCGTKFFTFSSADIELSRSTENSRDWNSEAPGVLYEDTPALDSVSTARARLTGDRPDPAQLTPSDLESTLIAQPVQPRVPSELPAATQPPHSQSSLTIAAEPHFMTQSSYIGQPQAFCSSSVSLTAPMSSYYAGTHMPYQLQAPTLMYAPVVQTTSQYTACNSFPYQAFTVQPMYLVPNPYASVHCFVPQSQPFAYAPAAALCV